MNARQIAGYALNTAVRNAEALARARSRKKAHKLACEGAWRSLAGARAFYMDGDFASSARQSVTSLSWSVGVQHEDFRSAYRLAYGEA